MFKWGIFKQLSWLRDTYDRQLKNFFKVHGFFSALREAFAFMKKKKKKKRKKKKEKLMSGCNAKPPNLLCHVFNPVLRPKG